MSTVRETAAALERGGVAVIPTDTVYGLAARLDRQDAIHSIFDIKGRDRDKALPVLGPSAEVLARIGVLDDAALSLAARHWPGPLTLVVRRAGGFTADLGGDERETVAVRVPAHPLALELLALTGPLAVTSANVSGEPPFTSAAAAREVFGDSVAAYLEAGEITGDASTVVSMVDGLRVLRAGALDAAELTQG